MSDQRARFRQSRTALSRVVGGEVLLAAPDGEDFDDLSESAGAIWRLLDVPRNVREVVEILGDRYGSPAAAIARDVETLVGDLVRRGFVEVIDDGA